MSGYSWDSIVDLATVSGNNLGNNRKAAGMSVFSELLRKDECKHPSTGYQKKT